MQKILKLVDIITGYMGSSDNPQKIATRMMGVYAMILSQFVEPIIRLYFSFQTVPSGVTPEQWAQYVNNAVQGLNSLGEPLVLILGAIWWGWGLFKYATRELSQKVQGIINRGSLPR